MLALEFMTNEIGVEWCKNCLRRRILVAGTLISATTIRVCPPLVILEQEIVHALREMRAACEDLRRHTAQARAHGACSKL